MITTPGAPDAPGGRPPDLPPTPQCLFPSAIKAGSAVVPVDSVGGSFDGGFLESALSVLGTTYDEQKVRERLSPTFVHGVHALQSARSAGWLTTYEFEEALLKLFTQSAAAAALTSTTPSPADSTSGGLGDDSVTPVALTPSAPSPAGCNSDGLGAQDATASARGGECLSAPSPTPRDVPGAQAAMEHLAPPLKTVDFIQPPSGHAAPTALQRSLQAASTSMGSASAEQRYPQANAPRMVCPNPSTKQTRLLH
jgi:hypothetical protein